MKICYINPTNNIRRPIAELSNLLSQQGHEITVMYPSSKACPTKNWVANEAVNNGRIKIIPIKSWYFAPLRYSFPNLIDLFKATKKIYKENDKVHIWEYYYPISVVPVLSGLFSKKRRKQTILTTDGYVAYSYTPQDPKWLVPAFKAYTQLFARFLFKIPDQLTTYGNALLPYAKKAGVPMNKLKVQSTGIHLEKFEKVTINEIENLREEFSIKEGEKVLLYVGMLTNRKGIDKVVSIGKRLLEEGMHVRTILVGDAHGENVWKKQVPENLKDKIIFTGGRTDIPQLMRFADLLILPSEGEGLPGVVMEAMASDLCVVASHEGCTPDLVSNGKGGILIPLGGDYYSAVRKLLLSDSLREEYAQAGKEKISHLDWSEVAKKYMALYR